jgi:hypothetical protein
MRALLFQSRHFANAILPAAASVDLSPGHLYELDRQFGPGANLASATAKAAFQNDPAII